MRDDNAGAFDAGRRLSAAAPGNPLALWAFLHALGARDAAIGVRARVMVERPSDENVAPLEPHEVDHVVACYRELHARRPELAQGEIILNVANELRWAKRTDDEERFYRETVAGASQIGQIAGALDLAGLRGDLPALVQLSERYYRLQAGRSTVYYSSGSYTFGGTVDAMCLGMAVSAGRKDFAQVLKLVDWSLEAARRKRERQSPGAAARARRAGSTNPGLPVLYQIFTGSGYLIARFAYPKENEYLDSGAITVLRTAFELYKRNDLLSDLVNHFRSQAAAARAPADATYPRLALAAIQWWSDERDDAIAELTKAVSAERPESDLRLDLASLLIQQGSPAEAIEVLDAVQPMDNMSLRHREELAITAAIAAGNAERAQRAAERLFGLRLETETQIELSAQMHQLGLHELADALLGRARRRAGGQGSRTGRADDPVSAPGQAGPGGADRAPDPSRVTQLRSRQLACFDRPGKRATGRDENPGRIGPIAADHRAHSRTAQEDAEFDRAAPDAR